MQALTGKQLGRYQLLEELGRGGMAVVYKAYQPSLNRHVAIKVLRGELTKDQQFVTRFRREALAAAKLKHPNIVQIHDAGVTDGIHFIVMDYVDGVSLDQLIARGPLASEHAIAIAIQLADALGYAHRLGLIHRDVKPGNILVTRSGRPMLTDFGIAKALHEATQLTQTGSSIGTPAYMAPEQIRGQGADGRTDIYALGLVLYEMLTGVAPFRAPTPVAAIYKQLHEPPPPLRQIHAGAPDWMQPVLERALAKRPADRYQRADDFARALRQRQTPRAHVPAVPPARAPARREPRRSRAFPVLVTTMIVVLVILVAMGIYLSWQVIVKGPGGTPAPVSPTTLVNPRAQASPVPTRTHTAAPPPPTVPSSRTLVVVAVTASPAPSLTWTPLALSTATPIPPTRTPTAKPPPPTKEPGLITDFETFGTWKRGDEPNGTFSQSAEQVVSGSYSGRLDYRFDTPSNDYVVFRQTHSLAGQPTRITAWIHGDGSGHFFNVWIKDSGGQTWQVPMGRVTHVGWQQMAGSLDTNQAWPWTHIDGPDNGVVDYPVSFVALVLDDGNDAYTGSGTIYVDDLRAEP